MRKTGKDVKIEMEVGTTLFAMSALTSVSSPSADVGKKYTTSATYLSDQEDLQPNVRLDGVISGFSITPSSSYNRVDITAGSVYIKGTSISVAAISIGDFKRATTSGQVLVTSLSVDSSGNINKRRGFPGVTTSTRGAAGGPPFIPVDEVLIGYVTLGYVDGSDSGQQVIVATEIDTESKERDTVPSYQILYHDGAGDNKTDVGCVEFYSQLPLIHAASRGGPGTARRNVYASYYEPSFEQIGNAKDFGFDEDVTTIASKAYQDSAEEKAISTPMWSGSGTVYWEKVNDILSLLKNTKRWVKYYPDKDNTEHWSGRCIVKVSRTLPVEDNLSASVTLEGSGQLYDKTS